MNGAAKSDVVFVCDLNAYRRRHTHDGEVCHVINGGPVPVEVIKDAVEHDAFIKTVLHDGNEIHTIKEFVDLVEFANGCRLAVALATL